jgi:diketogulonate reductase-like aldo/keto reductase
MRERAFGSTGVRLPVIGQGTWELERAERDAAVRALRRGLELGLTHIDTAEMYGDGAVEEIVGEALRGRREQAFVATKVLPENASRRGTVAACERSLARLGLERIDLYLLHWAGSHPLADTLAAFEELQAAGKIRFFGVSNFDAQEFEQAVELASARGGPGRIACNQVLYHLKERAIEHRVLPRCEALGVALVAYSPFGSGRFPASGSRAHHALEQVAREHGATPRQVALAFLTRRAAVFTIPKAARSEHVEENAGAGELELTGEDLSRLESAFPLGPEPRSLPSL